MKYLDRATRNLKRVYVATLDSINYVGCFYSLDKLLGLSESRVYSLEGGLTMGEDGDDSGLIYSLFSRNQRSNKGHKAKQRVDDKGKSIWNE